MTIVEFNFTTYFVQAMTLVDKKRNTLIAIGIGLLIFVLLMVGLYKFN